MAMKFDKEVISVETCYAGFFRLKRYRIRHNLYRGGMSAPLIRERVERLRAASVLLYDPQQDRVVMVEQFRIGALEEAGRGSWLLEPVGGVVHPGEEPEAVARREAREEAGCDVHDLIPICDFFVSPGTASERNFLFCGRVYAGSAGGLHGVQEEGEDIRVEVLTSDEAIAELYTGRLNSTSAIIAIQWLALHRGRLLREWR